MTPTRLTPALDCLAENGHILSERFHYCWDRQVEEAVLALRFRLAGRSIRDGSVGAAARRKPLSLVGIVGGASSGKSTVFNNLLGGRLVSRVTAKGHATRGPIAAVHESRRDDVEHAVQAGRLLPTFAPRKAGLDDRVEGDPVALYIAHHDVDALRDVVLIDTPDLTSEPARVEGDVAWATLPWFDRLIVLIDHERWFDRQTIGRLREASSQFGQERLVLFNRGKSGPLSPEESERLERQADRLGASDHLVLEFRHGRGFCTFPPRTFDRVLDRISACPPDRDASLVGTIGRIAVGVLNNNSERRARLTLLRDALNRAAEGAVPSRAECFRALMTADERRNLDVIARSLRVAETRQWLTQQADRIKRALRRGVPMIGRVLDAGTTAAPDRTVEPHDRQAIGWEVFRSCAERQLGSIDDAAEGSDFWAEVRRWTAIDPPRSRREAIDARQDLVRSLVSEFDAAVKAWTAKVASECSGVSPRLIGAIGAASIAGAVLLVAVSGPVGALTLPAIKAALGGALATLATTAGAGAIGGPVLGRLLRVVQENLLGSAEFDAVQAATERYRSAIAAFGREAADASLNAGSKLVLPENDKLARALAHLCDAAEID